MKIKEVSVCNFRCIKNEVLKFDDLTVLVGRNGAGKSTFIKAIEYFFSLSNNIEIEDFYNRNIEEDIEIEITFTELQEIEKEKFADYLINGQLTVSKQISFRNGSVSKYFAMQEQIPEFAKIRNLKGKQKIIDAFRKLVKDNKLNDLNVKIRSSDDALNAMRDYEERYPGLTKLTKREKQFIGAKNIGGGQLDEHTKFIQIPAVHDVKNEISGGNSAISKLLDIIIMRKMDQREEIRKMKKLFEDKLSEVFSIDNFRELTELGKDITKGLQLYSPGSELTITWDEISEPEINYPTPRVNVNEDKFEGNIVRKGHGLQRAIILTLFQYLAEKSHGDQSDVDTLDLILAIEEPELYQHPPRCRYLSKLLLELVSEDDNNTNQVVYTTHSPYFVDLDRFENIRLIRKISQNNLPIPVSSVNIYTLEKLVKDSASIENKDQDEFTVQGFKARAIPVMNYIVNEGFFANVAVVVEGLSEVGVLWKLQDILNKNWVELGIVIIPSGGKNNLDRPVLIFKGFSIPTYFIFDGDNKFQNMGDNKEDQAKNRNHKYLRLANAEIEDFPSTQSHEEWGVFENDLESEIKNELGDSQFTAMREQISIELGYNKPSRVLKNIEGISRFVEEIYNKNLSLPILEEFVNQITCKVQNSLP